MTIYPNFNSRVAWTLRVPFLAALGLFALTGAEAQVLTTPTVLSAPVTWADTVLSLAQTDGVLAAAAIPDTALGSAKGTGPWYAERAGLLLSAADLARHNQTPTRRQQLLQAAEQDLVSAIHIGFTTGAERAQCEYLLGYLAEKLHNDVLSAEAYYEKAATDDSANTQAAGAVARTKAVLAFRATLNS